MPLLKKAHISLLAAVGIRNGDFSDTRAWSTFRKRTILPGLSRVAASLVQLGTHEDSLYRIYG